jgi:hypothetical protein
MRSKLATWCSQYPAPRASREENAAARTAEDRRLAPFAGLDRLTRAQATALVGWKFQSMPHRRARALEGITPQRWKGDRETPGARDLIRRALAAEDDHEALNLIAAQGGGIHRFGPAMGSAILAACDPTRFTIADSRALNALRKLRLMPAGPPTFRMQDWDGYLIACRDLATSCRMSLRDVDRALWVAGA